MKYTNYCLTLLLLIPVWGTAQVNPDDELKYYNLSQQLLFQLAREPQKMDSIMTEIDRLDAVLLANKRIEKIKNIKLTYVSYMCEGYCDIRIEASPAAKTIVQIPKTIFGAQNDKKIKRTMVLKTRAWNQILDSFSIKEIKELPKRVGCPGCDDGAIGALHIFTNSDTLRIEFEGPDPPSAIKKLTKMLTKDVFMEQTSDKQ